MLDYVARYNVQSYSLLYVDTVKASTSKYTVRMYVSCMHVLLKFWLQRLNHVNVNFDFTALVLIKKDCYNHVYVWWLYLFALLLTRHSTISCATDRDRLSAHLSVCLSVCHLSSRPRHRCRTVSGPSAVNSGWITASHSSAMKNPSVVTQLDKAAAVKQTAAVSDRRRMCSKRSHVRRQRCRMRIEKMMSRCWPTPHALPAFETETNGYGHLTCYSPHKQ